MKNNKDRIFGTPAVAPDPELYNELVNAKNHEAVHKVLKKYGIEQSTEIANYFLNSENEKILWFIQNGYEEIDGLQFYKTIFPNNEAVGEYCTDFSKPNAIYYYFDEEKNKLRRRIMLRDSFDEEYEKLIKGNKQTLCGGLTYRKRDNKLNNAQNMNALIFDIDGVGVEELKAMRARWERTPGTLRAIPKPTYISLSGTGVHLYYIFEEPVQLYPNIKIQMKSLKYDLLFKIWDYKSTSTEKTIQYQSINQSFRMVGSINTKYGNVIRAFKTGNKIDVETLNAYASEENRVDLNKPFKPTQTTLAAAAEKYPEWYERVVVKGNKKKKKWDIAGKVNGEDPHALYHWWIKQADKIKGGHRYYFLMCMAIYACKCDVPKKQLKKDMKEIFDEIAEIQHKNPLTEADMISALEAYDKEYYDTSIKEIEYWTDVRIERNKRNGNSQAEHLKIARFIQDLKDPEGNWRGAKPKENIIREWQALNPDGKKSACHRQTGISRTTINKWWQ